RRLIKLGAAGCLLMLIAVDGFWLISFLGLLPDDIPQVSKISALAFIPLILTLPALRRLSSANFLPRLALINSGVLLAVALMLTPLPGRAFNVFAHQNSSQAYLELAEHLQPEDRVVVIWAYRTSLPFYTQRIYRPFQDRNELLYGMRLEPERPTEMTHPEEIRQLVAATEGRVFAVIEPKYYPEKWEELGIPYRHTGLIGDSKTIFLELLK
ncbi:MAG: hypothetical protein LC725_04325, partial [Lentisphaerae bacterium]|nr:hypothetical protein [Lentisphaerota bacterium]